VDAGPASTEHPSSDQGAPNNRTSAGIAASAASVWQRGTQQT